MKTMERLRDRTLTGERALFASRDLCADRCIFADGESPLKESRDIALSDCDFRWKYPLWYCENVSVMGGVWDINARAGVWYTNNLHMENALLECPKTFRRCRELTLKHVRLPNAEETLWDCRGIRLRDVEAKGNYFCMNCEDVEIYNLDLEGGYPFDGAKNVVIHSSRLISKDAFWNAENVTVYDSYIEGEYLGWNARNLTFVNCTIKSLQGLCYIDNLVMKNCRCEGTDLALEYSTVDVEIVGKIDSIKNPKSGSIRVGEIGELIMESDRVEPSNTRITLTKEV